jgi:putative peptidoglycan lipid II flippase
LSKHGGFAAHDVLMTRLALVAYSVGLVALVLVKILAPAFYARQNVKTPVKIAVISLIATQTMNLIFVLSFPAGFKHAGLALSIALAAWLNAGLLYWKLRQHGIFTPLDGWPMFLLKVAVALAVMAAVLLWLGADSNFWLQSGVWQRIERLTLVVVAGAASYFAVLWLSGFRPSEFSKRGS